jgi:uncharacterized damage-inducible protein DinB
MDPRVAPLNDLLHLNTRLFLNCLEGMDDATAARSTGEQANTVAVIALHVVDARYALAAATGAPATSPFAGPAAGPEGGEAPTRVPLAVLRTAWNEASTLLARRMGELGETDLAAPSPRRFPVADRSLLGGIAFLVQHESYHIGQLAFARRLLGLPPMTYKDQR